MVAYSFKGRFIGPIRAGLGIEHLNERGKIVIPGPVPKRQTIRAIGKRRHARPGETLQLYYAMRTRQCFKIGEAKCVSALPVKLQFIAWGSAVVGSGKVPENCYFDDRLHEFARADGFQSWDEMKEFWRKEHPAVDTFEGILIRWEPING